MTRCAICKRTLWKECKPLLEAPTFCIDCAMQACEEKLERLQSVCEWGHVRVECGLDCNEECPYRED